MKGSPVRVMVVDDSVVIRQVIKDALASDPGIEIVGTAQNGKVALEKLADVNPDLITLDLEMPEMDGLRTLEEMQRLQLRVPVIVFSTLTERGAKAALDALARGASDYVCKPSGQRNVQATMERIRSELIPKIHALSRRRAGVPAPASVGSPGLDVAPPSTAGADAPSARVELVVIGVSTGGPSALAEVIPRLPRELPVPVLIVQHMPPVFTKVLAQRLASTSRLKVREAEQRDRIEPGTVYIAPGDHHMRVAGSARESWLVLDQSPAENGCRPAVDPLFQTAAQAYGAGLLALILTGVGHDGTKGAGFIRRAGGTVWAQDEATSVAWGMPSSIISANLAQRVLPLALIARALTEAVLAGQGAAPGPRPRRAP